jgi:hypothetical protein
VARVEFYPWSLLTEVGDYFCVPSEVKLFAYMSQLVAQKNYRNDGLMKYVATKTSYGTIVMLTQIGEELPLHEFVSPDGILASTSRRHLIESRSEPNGSSIGEKAVVPKRTQGQIIAAMHWEVRNNNLPWWYDPVKGTLVVNTKLIKEPEADLLIKEVVVAEDYDYETGVPMLNTGEDDVDLDDK